MKIIQVKAINYRSFKEVTMELKPVNIIIGKNGSGKSSLLRLLPLILHSLESNSQQSLDLMPLGIELAGQYSDIVYNNLIASPISLGLTIDDSGAEFSFLTELIYNNQTKLIEVLSFNFISEDKSIKLKRDLKPTEETYIYNDSKVNLSFSGLIPDTSLLPHQELKQILAPLSKLKNLIKKDYLSYIGPFRRKFPRIFSTKNYLSGYVGYEGELAPYILSNLNSQSRGELLIDINTWMKKFMDNSGLKINNYEESFNVYVEKNGISTNIVDHGVGFSQVLPIIVSRFARDTRKIVGLEVIEQPELHLHPAMSGAIVDLYLTMLNDENNITVLETHSKELILRMRRRIAESSLSHHDCQLLFVDQQQGGSKLEYVEFDEEGTPNWWPEGIFEESFEEIIAIEEAIR
ncbi:hypothetical protein B0W48_06760 [Pseudoalteromonas aliena]|uniref:Endonuclease GajA/Old nuclease/RecF-like AAA domain-containing protein n=2 Tax=Pseudoalteromonas TaxID=53246 RepID=A0A1Q2GWR3_9GAMM|nr:AAA family ATPase [Pseudoalteromonas aliena]AQP99527.1 hypothetical protein B0W48_06760 [Pseudoalteromonas aliena]